MLLSLRPSLPIHFRQTDVHVNGEGNSPLNVTGYINLSLSSFARPLHHTFFVCSNLNHAAILGMDFLTRNAENQSFQESKLVLRPRELGLDPEEIPLFPLSTLQKDAACLPAPLVTAAREVLALRMGAHIRMKLPGTSALPNGAPVYMERIADALLAHLLIGNSVANVEDRELTLNVVNISGCYAQILRGAPLAIAMLCEVITEKDEGAEEQALPPPFVSATTSAAATGGSTQGSTRLIKGFLQIVFPLTSLLRKHTPFVWEEPQRRAFEALKEALTSEPVLCHPDFDKEFVVQPDASNDAIGAVLRQTDEKRNEKVVAYASRMMTDLEKKWGITEREALSLVYAVDTFNPYLYGKKFTVITDHKALQHIHDQKDSQPRVMKWALKLAIYEFDVQHCSGAKHADADSMTKPPVAGTGASLELPSPKRKRDRDTDSDEEDEIVVAPCNTGGAAVEVDGSNRKHELNMSTNSEVEIISVLSPGKAAVHCKGSKDWAVRPQSLHPLRVAAGKRGRPWKDNSMNSSNAKKVMKDPKPSKGWRRPTGPGRPRSGPKAAPPSPSLSAPLCTGNYSIEEFKRLQKEDSTLNPVIQFLMDGSLPDDQAELLRVYSMAASHALHEGLLVRFLPPLNKHTKGFRRLIVVPCALRAEILANHHGHLCTGHGGIRSTLAKVTDKFFWPTVTADVENYVKSCETCQQRKDAFKKEHLMIVSLSIEPLTHIAVDTVGPLPTSEGKRVIISVMDLASRFVVLIAVPNQKATTIARALLDNVFFVSGSPVTLLSDQGPSFLDPIVTAVSELVGTKRVYTSMYNPKANGKLKRMHRELKQTLSAYIAEHQKD
uniref:Integrase catalytic domain-containing protein n=1 Tax=Chromera velia CCMP2878 TaxID=1169474 RepID=A0A0G4H374_9ALVE|eukprot:Cvel_24522.t1-p1 / transcript=Cvel_24522.t1 / gene=Cvel_24522 / organism=Chromera_velia_CCMP2878 / gene_product=Retrovirus-related Pol polyprotein from transposon, putative / transcript_product=Retrovirus-related Pol polyprotein from transposon, putative / location=Cvel_scaffold2660:20841-24339(+) / protein_length=834 / sequence_SO=supercontig / SO=protein_coding / is_pseudo=false